MGALKFKIKLESVEVKLTHLIEKKVDVLEISCKVIQNSYSETAAKSVRNGFYEERTETNPEPQLIKSDNTRELDQKRLTKYLLKLAMTQTSKN